jgi:hypothetical protein
MATTNLLIDQTRISCPMQVVTMAAASPPSPPLPTEEVAPRLSGPKRAAAVLAIATVCLLSYACHQELPHRALTLDPRHGIMPSEDTVAYETEGGLSFSEKALASGPVSRSSPSQGYKGMRDRQRWCTFRELSDPNVMKWVPVGSNETQGEETHVLRPVNASCVLRFTRDEEVGAARKCLAGRSIVFLGDSLTRLVRFLMFSVAGVLCCREVLCVTPSLPIVGFPFITPFLPEPMD